MKQYNRSTSGTRKQFLRNHKVVKLSMVLSTNSIQFSGIVCFRCKAALSLCATECGAMPTTHYTTSINIKTGSALKNSFSSQPSNWVKHKESSQSEALYNSINILTDVSI